MDFSRVAVFGTTHIMSSRPVFAGQKPVHTEFHRGRRLDTYSTGRLEEALSKGYEVFVCSIRPSFGKHDAWWRRLLGADRVLNAKGLLAAADGASALAAAFAPWRELYRRLGAHWPEGKFIDIDDPADWLSAEYGVVRGASFRGHCLVS
jgi:hypothetical protein